MHSFGAEIIKGMLDTDLKGLWGVGPVPWKEQGRFSSSWVARLEVLEKAGRPGGLVASGLGSELVVGN